MIGDRVVDDNFLFIKQHSGIWLCTNDVDGVQFGTVRFHQDWSWYFHPFVNTCYSSSAIEAIEKFMNGLRMADMETVR